MNVVKDFLDNLYDIAKKAEERMNLYKPDIQLVPEYINSVDEITCTVQVKKNNTGLNITLMMEYDDTDVGYAMVVYTDYNKLSKIISSYPVVLSNKEDINKWLHLLDRVVEDPYCITSTTRSKKLQEYLQKANEFREKVLKHTEEIELCQIESEDEIVIPSIQIKKQCGKVWNSLKLAYADDSEEIKIESIWVKDKDKVATVRGKVDISGFSDFRYEVELLNEKVYAQAGIKTDIRFAIYSDYDTEWNAIPVIVQNELKEAIDTHYNFLERVYQKYAILRRIEGITEKLRMSGKNQSKDLGI